MKRPRNVDCGKIRRPLKRSKITDGIYGRYVFTFSIWQFIAYFTWCQNRKTVPLETEYFAAAVHCGNDRSWNVRLGTANVAWIYAFLLAKYFERRCCFCYVGMVSAFKSSSQRKSLAVHVWNHDELQHRDKRHNRDCDNNRGEVCTRLGSGSWWVLR